MKNNGRGHLVNVGDREHGAWENECVERTGV